MTDEELIAHLRLQGLDKDIAAADRIEQLVATNEGLKADVAGWISNAQAASGWASEAEYKLEDAEAKLAECEARLSKAVEALQKIAKKPLYDGFLLVWWIDSTIKLAAATLKELEKANDPRSPMPCF